MDENETTIEDTDEIEELDDVEENDTTDWKAEAEKARGIAQRAKTKLEKAQKALKDKETPEPAKKIEAKPGELDETQLDYLDLKGVSEPEDVDVIQKIVERTGMTVRQALKDDYVVAKLDANRAQRAVKDATPSATKRGGGQVDTLAAALAKFDSDQSLPEDFALRTAVVNAIADRSTSNKPSWH